MISPDWSDGHIRLQIEISCIKMLCKPIFHNIYIYRHIQKYKSTSNIKPKKDNLGRHESWVTRVGSNETDEAPLFNLRTDSYLMRNTANLIVLFIFMHKEKLKMGLCSSYLGNPINETERSGRKQRKQNKIDRKCRQSIRKRNWSETQKVFSVIGSIRGVYFIEQCNQIQRGKCK